MPSGPRTRAALVVGLALAALAATAHAHHSVTELVSDRIAAGSDAEEELFFQGMAPDGSRIWFLTLESLVEGDSDGGAYDVYERSGGGTTLVSDRVQAGADEADGASFAGTSKDGSRVFFETEEDLVADDGDSSRDVYERSGGTTTLLSDRVQGPTDDAEHAFFVGASEDGTRVFFTTSEQIVADDGDDAQDLYERSGGTTKFLSDRVKSGADAELSALFSGASKDGTRVFFQTDEQIVDADSDSAATDVYERAGSTTTLISDRVQAGQDDETSAFFAGAADDGSPAYFHATEQIVDQDDDGAQDVYRYSGAAPEIISDRVQDTSDEAHSASLEDLSSDGARAFFETDEDLVAGDTDGARWDVYENSGTVPVLLSDRQQAGADGEFDASIEGSSDDGTRVFFATGEPLLAADSDCTDPITCYTDVYQRSDSQTTLLTDRVQDSSDQEYAAHFEQATPSGTHVFFRTDEPLVAEDGDSNQDVYQHSDGDTTLLSDRVQPGPDALLANAGFRGASSDGSRVFFNTDEPLLAEDGDEHGDLYERSGGTTTLLSDRKQPGPDALNEPAHFEDASDDGTRVVFNTNEPLLAGDGDSAVDLYLARLADPAPPLPDGGGGSGGGAGGGGAGGPLGGGLVVDLLAPTMGIAGGTIRAKATYVPVPLRCPAGEIVCTGTLALDTARPVATQRRRRLRLGRASFRIPGGARRVVRVRLSRRNRRLLARRKRLRVVASANARDAAGNAKLTRRTLTVRAPKPRRRR